LAIAMFLCVMAYGTFGVSNDRGTVAELITEYRTAEDVRAVFYQPEGGTQLHEVHAREDALFAYLSSLETEKFSSANEMHDFGGQRISLTLDKHGTMVMTFHDRFIEVYHYHNGGKAEYYYLRSALDWDAVTGCLDLEAER